MCLIRAAKQSTQQQGKATAPIPDLAKSPPLHRSSEDSDAGAKVVVSKGFEEEGEKIVVEGE